VLPHFKKEKTVFQCCATIAQVPTKLLPFDIPAISWVQKKKNEAKILAIWDVPKREKKTLRSQYVKKRKNQVEWRKRLSREAHRRQKKSSGYMCSASSPRSFRKFLPSL